ncbi:MAG: hypothetical protein COZ12_03935 [Deltaproteobacteria bacterium CG_4_10_14_3_um_filter_60_8]|nr:MAG: hypothetical protein AUK28_06075 [Desulfobacterales bacterium CG2_30_60_27]PIP42770.1 MAG: hypothetical protein COX17_10735 [Deltaproteobacteria bacterium CG23_combo_of_CG06-09_8_20_14_all_60_8]PIY21869.1 MAG: hypothetical protein COZ12_03935 [Deltaproteobacteria bacterium CG_4_10_14_3_um_filter_60_8]
MLRPFMKPISLLLIFSFLLLQFSVQQAKAGMIDTDLAMATHDNGRTRILAFLDRPEVQQALEQQGVDRAEARQRVASLSDSEVTKIAHAMQQLPAGGDGLGTVVGAAVLIFLVLLITDIMGLTHVFPFVRH